MDIFTISPSSGVPIYKQLVSQIERMILNGFFNQGDALPSVRQVAAELEVNPMTVSKAYGLLEERGFLTRLRGKGMVVAQRDTDVSNKEKAMHLKQMVASLVAEAQQMNIDNDQLLALVQEQLVSNSKNKDSDFNGCKE